MRRTDGFSLVELVTATTILSILSLVLIHLSNNAGRVWSQGESQNQHRQRARTVLDFIGRELKHATLSTGYNAGRPSLQFLINDPTLGSEYRNRDTIFWQAPVATETSAGDLAEIGYFVRWNGTQANLCRFFVNPRDTANYLIYRSPSQAWITDDVLDAVSPADKTNSYQGLFLENVLGLWVNGYRSNGSAYGGDSRTTTPANRLPAYVELSLVLIDASTASQLKNGAAAPSTIRSLYSTTTSAEEFMAQLPRPLSGGASLVKVRVKLDNHKP
ncbi:MAG: type II secretion system protein J [Candidatus Methylacidiphilales bacterium]